MRTIRAVIVSALFAFAAIAVLTLLPRAARAQSCVSGAIPCFQGLGTVTAAAVNNNANVAGSIVLSPAQSEAAIWVNGTINLLGFLSPCGNTCTSSATGISSDGSVIAGISSDANGNTQAVRWVNGVISGLGYLPGCTSSCGTQATGVSSDGSTVVGWGTTSNLTEAFSWSNGSLSVLQAPPCSGPFCNYQANAVNSNGSTIVGSIGQNFSPQPVEWTNGTPSDLVNEGWQCSEGFCGSATGVNSDGSVIVGYGGVGCYIGFCGTSEAGRWVNGTFNFLGFPGTCTSDSCFSQGNGVSADGSTVVGTGSVGAGNVALVWSPAIGMQSVQTILASCGGVNATGWTLTSAVAISADGKTIVGTGVDPSGATESWIARLQFSSCSVASPMLAAVLPESRSVQVGNTATVFATIINTAATTASGCGIGLASSLPATLLYQTTDPTTNALTGSANTPADIAAGGLQSFVIALTPSAAISPTNVPFYFSCIDVPAAPSVTGLNTLLFSASTNQPPDIIALAATLQNDGIVHVINGTPPTGVFAVATDNLGSADNITVATSIGTMLPITVTVCQTNPSTGECIQLPSATVTTDIASNATPTFAIFVSANGTVPFNPATNRIFVTFTDSTNAVRGETSVAVETQ